MSHLENRGSSSKEKGKVKDIKILTKKDTLDVLQYELSSRLPSDRYISAQSIESIASEIKPIEQIMNQSVGNINSSRRLDYENYEKIRRRATSFSSTLKHPIERMRQVDNLDKRQHEKNE